MKTAPEVALRRAVATSVPFSGAMRVLSCCSGRVGDHPLVGDGRRHENVRYGEEDERLDRATGGPDGVQGGVGGGVGDQEATGHECELLHCNLLYSVRYGCIESVI
jgi:hypothetical protein